MQLEGEFSGCSGHGLCNFHSRYWADVFLIRELILAHELHRVARLLRRLVPLRVRQILPIHGLIGFIFAVDAEDFPISAIVNDDSFLLMWRRQTMSKGLEAIGEHSSLASVWILRAEGWEWSSVILYQGEGTCCFHHDWVLLYGHRYLVITRRSLGDFKCALSTLIPLRQDLLLDGQRFSLSSTINEILNQLSFPNFVL